jgi:hypothetical protein
MEVITKLFEMLPQCGIVSMTFAAATAWLAMQLERVRSASEKAAEKRITAFETLAMATGETKSMLSKIEGLLTAMLARNSM